MRSRPGVAVVVATYDRVPFLAECLAAIAGQLGPGDDLVVAEGGEPAAAEVVAAVGRPVTHRVVRPAGKSRQLNDALRRTDAEVVLLTDDDCRVEPGWVDAMAAPFADPSVGVVLGRVVGLSSVPGSGPPPSVAPGPAPFETWTYAHGAALGLRRTAAVAVGGFDERLGPGAPARAGEDHDLLLRMRERGAAVVVADAPPVTHLDWRDAAADRSNALAYERGAGVFVGAALRRRGPGARTLLKHRLGYQRQLLGMPGQRRFGARALAAFTAGLAHGLRLPAWPIDADPAVAAARR